MFASWNKARKVSLVAAVATLAIVALVATPDTQALEGLQGRHAIFYPSVELVWQHDDNYFLSENNEVSANTFIARANFQLEIPGARQYLKLKYSPQFRDVDVNNSNVDPIPDDVQHFWELMAKLRGSSLFSVDINQDFVVGNIEVHELDGNDELIRGAEQFTKHDISADFKWEGSRQGAVVHVGRLDTEFDSLRSAPRWFESGRTALGIKYFYKFTPLTSFQVGFDHESWDQDYTYDFDGSGTQGDAGDSIDSTRNEVFLGFDGELGRTTTGDARIGFVSWDWDNRAFLTDANDFDGMTLEANVRKSFSRYSKLIFGAERDVNASANGGNTHYVSNSAAVTFTNQPQGARVGWSVAGKFQRNSYEVEQDNGSGMLVEREDDITHFRGEVGYHPLEHLSFRLNYRYEDRDSNIANRSYTDNLIIFQVQFGF